MIVDETQDLSSEAFRLPRTIVPAGENDFFIVGDADQRIYRHRVSLGKATSTSRGRGKKLKINCRTADEIRSFAVGLLEGCPIDDLDGGQVDQKGHMSVTRGAVPTVMTSADGVEETAYLKQHIQAFAAQGSPLESICIVVRTKKLVENDAGHLRETGIETFEVKPDWEEHRDRPGVRVATMHLVRGREFAHHRREPEPRDLTARPGTRCRR